jgi:hypothetical protein
MRFFNRKTNSVGFVRGLRTLIITSLLPMMERYPELEGVINKSGSTSNWDFFMTVAGVGWYIYTREPNEKVFKEVAREMAIIDEEMTGALSNYLNFMLSNSKLEVQLTNTAGMWVLWNMLGEFPEHADSAKLAPAIGTYLSNLIDDLESEYL